MDLAQLIYNITENVDINRNALILIICLFALGLFNLINRNVASSLMINVGIGGTFLGIFIALYPLGFSTESIEDDIQLLLRGMTTAFVTSLLGITGSLGSRFLWSWNIKWIQKPSPQHKDITGKLDEIKKAIAGDEDSSLVTQIHKFRNENRDNMIELNGKMENLADAIKGELVKSMEDLIKQIKDIIAKQLTESLERLIKSIETALIEQFGETFIEFNKGVQAIKKWQEDNKEHVQQMTEAFTQATNNIELINTSMTAIKDSTAAIPENVEKLSKIFSTADEQITNLKESLQAFSDMKDNAVKAFPVIESKLNELGNNLFESTKGLVDLKTNIQHVVDTYTKGSEQIIDSCTKSMEKALNDSNETIEQAVTKNIAIIREQSSTEIKNIAKEYVDNMVAIARKCSEEINKYDR